MKSKYKYFSTIILIWVGCFVLLLFANMLFLSSQRKARKDIARQLDEKKQICESAENIAKEKTKTRLAEQIIELENILKNLAIDSEGSTDLTFDISKIANDREVSSFSIRTVDKITVSKSLQLKHISEDSIDIRFKTGFNQFAFLLNDLERHCPAVFIDDFTITRSKNSDPLHQVEMSLSVFVRKQKES